MIKLNHLNKKKIPNSYFIKRVNQRLRESIQNIDIQDQLYTLFDPTSININKANTINNDDKLYYNTDTNINSNSHKQLAKNRLYMSSFIDLNDKRSIFRRMYGEFCNINNYESVLGKQKKIFELKDFFDDNSLKFLLFKLKIRNKQKLLFQSNSNSHIHQRQNKNPKRKNFNSINNINSYLTATYDKNITIPKNKESKTISSEKEDNELANYLNNFNTLEVSKNSINNSTQKQKYFGQFSTKNLGKFQTINNYDSMIPTKTNYNFTHKNNNFNNNYSTNKKFKKNINSFLSSKKNEQKRLEIQSKTQSILDKNKNIRNKIYYLKRKTNSYINDESKDTYLQNENNYPIFKESPILGYGLGGVDPMMAQHLGIRYSTEINGLATSVAGEILVATGIATVFILLYFCKLQTPSSILRGLVIALNFELMILVFNQNILRPYLWMHLAVISASIKCLREQGKHRKMLVGYPTTS